MILPEQCWERALALSEEESNWDADGAYSVDEEDSDGCAFRGEGEEEVGGWSNTC